MTDIQPMFFVGRIDASHDSGLQRAFGAFADESAAARFRDELAAHMVGTFMVFEGTPKPDASAATVVNAAIVIDAATIEGSAPRPDADNDGTPAS